jgi:ADP-dependent phosphofructokinase/glucokinase
MSIMSLDNLVSKLLYRGLVTVSNVEQALGLEAPASKLISQHIIELEKIFLSTVDYTKVVIKAGNSHLLTVSGRAFVMGNTIYMPKETYTMSLLIHEMVHIWQYQNRGYDYISKSLRGQYLGEGYDFVKGIENGKPWAELNPEQQAALIEKAYISGFFHGIDRDFIYQGRNYTGYLKQSLEQLRKGKAKNNIIM